MLWKSILQRLIQIETERKVMWAYMETWATDFVLFDLFR
jgi:hypothetical protein